MASSREYLDFILEQLIGLEGISYRAMMGEYILYYKNKVIGGIYDNRFLLKITESSEKFIPNTKIEIPYEGAKGMLLFDDFENKEFLVELFEKMYGELPMPKNKGSVYYKGEKLEGVTYSQIEILEKSDKVDDRKVPGYRK